LKRGFKQACGGLEEAVSGERVDVLAEMVASAAEKVKHDSETKLDLLLAYKEGLHAND
jgi:hypothetical protein